MPPCSARIKNAAELIIIRSRNGRAICPADPTNKLYHEVFSVLTVWYNEAMKYQPKSRQKKATVNSRIGGYSDMRLWPCYMAYSGLILFLAPQIGILLAVVVVGFPFLMIAKKVADTTVGNRPVVRYDIDQWIKDMRAAVDNRMPIPRMESYEVTELKHPKQTVIRHSNISDSKPALNQV
jgi:hypothetical protein